MNQLPPARDARVGELVVKPHRRGEQDELDEDHARQRIAEELPSSDAGDNRIPEDVGRYKPEVREGVAEPPEVGAGHNRVDAIHETQRPRQDQDDDLHGEAAGGEDPDDDAASIPTRWQRDASVPMGAAPTTKLPIITPHQIHDPTTSNVAPT